jgi:hypothetical protein
MERYACPVISAGLGNAKVAADAQNNHIYVALGANNVYPDCLTGCIAVFSGPSKDE